MTSSPAANSVTAGPTRSTTPATSQQGTSGKWFGKRSLSPPRTDFQSTGLSPTALVRMRTVSGPTMGSGTSVSSRTSLPPKRLVAMARIAGRLYFLAFLVAFLAGALAAGALAAGALVAAFLAGAALAAGAAFLGAA